MGATARRRRAANPRKRQFSATDPADSTATVEPSQKRPRCMLPRGISRDSELGRLHLLYNAGYTAWWSATNEDIIACHRLRWRSPVYDHYSIRIVREYDNDGAKLDLKFEFVCKLNDPQHAPWQRPCDMGGDGTCDLLRGKRNCEARNNINMARPASALPPYSESVHRTVIALRCAVNKRSFESVVDPLHLLECQILRQDPDFKLPSPITVGRDVERIYEGLSPHLSLYFKHRGRVYHLVFDGWSTPIKTANLGISLCYEHKGKMYRTTLDLVRLTGSHTGQNLAQTIANALKKAGIDHWLYLTNGDNAANCNVAVRDLPELIPGFGGLVDRLRCFTHSTHLCADTLTSFFRKLRVRGKKTSPAADSSSSTTSEPPSSSSGNTRQDVNGATLNQHHPEEDEDEVELDTTLEREETDEEAAARIASDAGQEEHDMAKVVKLRDVAIQDMRAGGIIIPDDEARAAINVITKLAALAIKVTEPGVLGEGFRALVADESMQQCMAVDRANYGDYRTLARRNATRWDSEYRLLKSCLALRLVIVKMTGNVDLKLRAYRLTDCEWRLARDLFDMLAPFEELTQKFQRADIPLIVEVVPAFTQLQTDLTSMVYNTTLPPVCRVAAYASLLMAKKYVDLFGQSDAYIAAIAMCPDRKLAWFKERDYPDAQIAQIRTAVVKRFERFCSRFGLTPPASAVSSSTSTASSPSAATATPSQPMGSARWRSAAGPQPSRPAPISPADIMNAYLDTPTVTLPKNTTILQYWDDELNSEHGIEALAKFGLAMTSAPATSVDIERVFSEGRNQINWNQESMSSQAFRAQMCVASWYSAPWFSLDLANQVVQDSSRALRGTVSPN